LIASAIVFCSYKLDGSVTDTGICTIFFHHFATVVVHFTVLSSIKIELGLRCAKLVEFITCLESSAM
jgi:hypothetical protein